MKKLSIYMTSLLACLATSLGMAAEFNFKAGTDQPIGSSYDVMLNDFAKMVGERSNGRIAIKVFPAAQLGSELELAQGLRLGTVDFTATSVGNIASLVPKVAILGAPYIFDDIDHRQRVISQGSDFYKALADYVDHSQAGIKMLGITTAGVRSLYNSKKPVHTLEDLKGMKVRTLTSEAQVEGWRNLGALPTPIAFAELYSALQTGVVDGAENSPEFLYLMKHYEQAPYYSLTEHMMATGLFMVSERVWKKLPEDLQKIVLQAGAEATAKEQQFDMKNSEGYMEKLKALGVKVNTIDKGPWIKVSLPLHDKIAKEVDGADLLQLIRAASEKK